MIVGSQIAWPMAMSCADASCLADELIGDNYTPTHLAAIDCDGGSPRRSDWPERDRALLLTAVLAGLRADELIGVDVGRALLHSLPTTMTLGEDIPQKRGGVYSFF